MKLRNPIECFDCDYDTDKKSAHIVVMIRPDTWLYQCLDCKRIITYPESRISILHDAKYEGKLGLLNE